MITIESIDQLYTTRRLALFNHARRYSEDIDECWDIVHDVFMDLLHHRDKLCDRNLEAYAKRAIYHKFVDLNGSND